MKIKKFNILKERDEFDSTYDQEDDYNNDNSEDMKHLCYLLRQMIRNSGVYDVSVESSDLDVYISVLFNKTEQLKDIIKTFEVIKKIKKDILAQYKDSYEIWENKSGDPIISFEFNYNDTAPW